MKRRLFILLAAFLASLVAGAWDRIGSLQTHSSAVQSPLATLAAQGSAVFESAVTRISPTVEATCFLVFGACFISMAWVLRRKSANNREQ